MTEFEKRVKAKFIENDIDSVLKFCELVGVSDRAMRNIFKRQDCKVSLLLKMCEVLNCRANDLLY